MTRLNRKQLAAARQRKLGEASAILKALGFGPKQCNDGAGYTLLALVDLKPDQTWAQVNAPLCGITPIIKFIQDNYDVPYAPNTRETIRDEAVKHFVAAGVLVRNPDDPTRPTNSGKTVYQIEAHALELLRSYGMPEWFTRLQEYCDQQKPIRSELERQREFNRVPVRLPNGVAITLSPGGQNPLIKTVIEEFCPRFAPNSTVLYIGDAENKFLHLDAKCLQALGVTVPAPAKMPDLVVYDTQRNWLILLEAVTSVGPVDGKRRKELKELFSGCTAGLVFVTAFATRATMRTFLASLSWETEVWIAEDPNHMIHFNGERFLGPYPDVLPRATK